jgi:hypothetical protein
MIQASFDKIDPRIGQLEALVIGTWSDEVYTKDSSEIVRHLTTILVIETDTVLANSIT